MKGDLFTTKCNIIGHGVNCRGVFNAGIAQQIRKRYSEAYDAYILKYSSTGWRQGDVQIIRIHKEQNRFIANLATQYTFGRDGKYAAVSYIDECLGKLVDYSLKYGLTIALPMIGCGLGGLKSEEVIPIFEKHAEKSLVYIEVWSLNG